MYGGGTASRLLIGGLSFRIFHVVKGEWLLYSYNSVWTLLASISLFLLFRNIQIRNARISKLINAIGSLTFGTYLWSEHRLIRQPLWQTVNIPEMAYRGIFTVIAYMMIVIAGIMFIGCAFEWLRLRLFHLLGINRFFEKLDKKYRDRDSKKE